MSQQKQSIKNELHTKINYKKIRPDEFTFIINLLILQQKILLNKKKHNSMKI
jgi:hypothetical protein